MRTRQFIVAASVLLVALSGCSNQYNIVYKSQDYDYKYEVAKQCYVAGKYTQCYQLLGDLTMVLKGSTQAEECLMLNAMCYYRIGDYETAVIYFDRYVKSYPRGEYAELARYYSGKSQYMQSPDSRLDQTSTYSAITQLQSFLEFYPYSERCAEVNDMIYQLQDRLVRKEYDAAKLYFNLGSYTGNCTQGGNNYEASIITAENALRAYPYTSMREDLYMLILRARYQLAINSVEEKMDTRLTETIDEYYGFKNEFPESKYTAEADHIFRQVNERVKK